MSAHTKKIKTLKTRAKQALKKVRTHSLCALHIVCALENRPLSNGTKLIPKNPYKLIKKYECLKKSLEKQLSRRQKTVWIYGRRGVRGSPTAAIASAMGVVTVERRANRKGKANFYLGSITGKRTQSVRSYFSQHHE